MADEQDASRGFKVTDRRRFTDEGDARADTAPQAAEPGADTPPGGPAAPLSFGTFILGLSTQALVALGEVEHPLSKKRETDLAAARQLIDIMVLLRDKTRGNLDADEDKLLDSVVYDLRMRFVELVRRSGK